MASYMKFDQEDDQRGYRWETEYEKTWETIKESENGLIEGAVEEIEHRVKRNRILKTKNLRLGMMRHLYLILDMSTSMNDRDFKPTRLVCTIKLMEMFLKEFFDQNPISQVGLIVTRNKRGERISELSSNLNVHLEALKKLYDVSCIGEPSLLNSLELAQAVLRLFFGFYFEKHMPTHTSKEVVLILGSLTTCDPSDITETIGTLELSNIRCSVINLSAEVRIQHHLAKRTKGTFDVILDESHFKEALFTHLQPPPSTSKTESSLIKMGFPDQFNANVGKPSMCVCHPGESNNFSQEGYFCPQCASKYCALPIECQICGLTLVSSTHLSRSYHHLFPIDLFTETELEQQIDCFSCMKETKKAAKCEKCGRLFCVDCDVFCHTVLHFCPGCASK